MIKKRELKTFIERIYCDECGSEMHCVSKRPPSLKYRYLCPNCGSQVTLSEYYPREVQEECDLD